MGFRNCVWMAFTSRKHGSQWSASGLSGTGSAQCLTLSATPGHVGLILKYGAHGGCQLRCGRCTSTPACSAVHPPPWALERCNCQGHSNLVAVLSLNRDGTVTVVNIAASCATSLSVVTVSQYHNPSSCGDSNAALSSGAAVACMSPHTNDA